jgi:hypothetical protein
LHTKFVAETNLAIGQFVRVMEKGKKDSQITRNNTNTISIQRHMKTFSISINMYVK